MIDHAGYLERSGKEASWPIPLRATRTTPRVNRHRNPLRCGLLRAGLLLRTLLRRSLPGLPLVPTLRRLGAEHGGALPRRRRSIVYYCKREETWIRRLSPPRAFAHSLSFSPGAASERSTRIMSSPSALAEIRTESRFSSAPTIIRCWSRSLVASFTGARVRTVPGRIAIPERRKRASVVSTASESRWTFSALFTTLRL